MRNDGGQEAHIINTKSEELYRCIKEGKRDAVRVCDGEGDGAVRCGATRALPHCSPRKISHFREQGATKLPAWKRLRPRWPYSNIAMGRSQ